MAIITPQTDIYLLKCPLTLSNKHQITFQNETSQHNYFNSLPKIGLTDGSYLRKDGVLRYPAHIDNIMEYNYCMYRNDNYSNKWFYAYIVNMIYVNDNMTNIILKTDVYQTWQFNLTWKQSFIEREMLAVSDDIPGANLIPESLETGEYQIDGTAEIGDLEPWYIVAYAEDTYGHTYNGIYSGIEFYAYSDTSLLLGFLMQVQQAGKSDFILNIFTVPKLAFYPNSTINGNLDNDRMATPRPVTLISRPSTLDGYTPRNQKLRTYPYMYVGFNPTSGSSKIYRYEDFTNGTPVFNMISEINPNPTVCIIPQNYRGQTGNSLSDIATLNGYPSISWSNDTYNVWLAQNKDIVSLQMEQEEFNTKMGLVDSMAQVGGSIGTALGGIGQDTQGALGSMANAIFQTANGVKDFYAKDKNYEYYQKMQMAQIEKQQKLPNNGSFGGNNATLLGYSLMDNNIFTRYTIKRQFAERIDKYFDMYGYLTNQVKTPNINNRPNWNYVKTIGANILGNIPQMDLQEIKDMFDNGLTLWHNTTTFLDYSQSNR